MSAQVNNPADVQADTGQSSFEAYQLVSAIFLRLLGVIYLIAFASLAVQIEGLVGSDGIIPIVDELARLEATVGTERFFQLPTLFWFNASDFSLVAACISGCIASLLIMFNRWQRTALLVAFVLYFSLHKASQPFLNFQWDGLLLETGFLALFLGTRTRIIIWLFRWLLFRLRFLSGLSKLTSGDPTWAGFTALNTYFEVQPLPNPLSWYAHQLPEWLLRTGTAGTLIVEILVPFMMFMPRRWRFAAAWITIFWQLLIILTSNHNWINLLTIVLCLFLFDDRAVRSVLPKRFHTIADMQPAQTSAIRGSGAFVTGVLAVFILSFNVAQFWSMTTRQPVSGSLGTVLGAIESYRLVNTYHVFPTMTTERVELELSGSYDGREWKQYRFKYKPEEPDENPPLVMPHQPRLDWQMWFVPLQTKQLPWFEQFVYALLNNASGATSLLQHNPFADAPPRFIRVDAVRYTFSTPEQREMTGNWWQREPLGPFLPLPWVAGGR